MTIQAVEFNALVENGQLILSDEFKALESKKVRVVLLIEEDSKKDNDLHLLSNHSASLIEDLIEEWKDPAEDEVWT